MDQNLLVKLISGVPSFAGVSVVCIPFSLRHDLVCEYMQHCEWSYARFGMRATNWLSTPNYFNGWLDRLKHFPNKAIPAKTYSQHACLRFLQVCPVMSGLIVTQK